MLSAGHFVRNGQTREMSLVQVLIENEAGSSDKNTFDERTLEFLHRARVSRAYPYPYGFVLGTRGGDGTRSIASC
jgi:inorganic pyrophosphatase